MKHEVEHIELKNGAKGLLIDVSDAPVMHVLLNFRAGDFLSPDNKWEVAHLLEHMMLGANKSYPKAREFQAALQKNGAFFNAYTNAYDITYVGECADFEWDRILNLFMVALEQPLLKEDEFIAERGNVREELSGDLNEHFRQLLIASRQAHGMVSLPDGQRLTQLMNIEPKDVRTHYEKTHTTDNLRFVIAGKIKGRRDQIVKRLEETTLGRGSRIAMPIETATGLMEPLYIERNGVDNLHFILSVLATKTLNVKDEDALDMLNIMLTSTIHSGIQGEIREKGLAYSISSAASRGGGMPNWWVGAQLLPENATPVFEIVTRHLSQILKSKIMDDEVEAAKQYALGRFQRSVQTVGQLARGYTRSFFYDGQIEDYANIEKRIMAVKKTELSKIAKRMFEEELWGLSILGTCGEETAKTLNDQASTLWS